MPVSPELPRFPSCSVPRMTVRAPHPPEPHPFTSAALERVRPSGLPGESSGHLAASRGLLCTQEAGHEGPAPVSRLLVEPTLPPAQHPPNAASPAERWGQETWAPPQASSPRKDPLCNFRPYSLPGAGTSASGATCLTANLCGRRDPHRQPRPPVWPPGQVMTCWMTGWLMALRSRSLTCGAMTSSQDQRLHGGEEGPTGR